MAYEEILDRIVESDTLVTVSMGNAGGWADYALSGVPYLYGDDVSLSTGGSPARLHQWPERCRRGQRRLHRAVSGSG